MSFSRMSSSLRYSTLSYSSTPCAFKKRYELIRSSMLELTLVDNSLFTGTRSSTPSAPEGASYLKFSN